MAFLALIKRSPQHGRIKAMTAAMRLLRAPACYELESMLQECAKAVLVYRSRLGTFESFASPVLSCPTACDMVRHHGIS
jgi:hypothetical protein